jgi:TCP-1/cpn60 chaperonin family
MDRLLRSIIATSRGETFQEFIAHTSSKDDGTGSSPYSHHHSSHPHSSHTTADRETAKLMIRILAQSKLPSCYEWFTARLCARLIQAVLRSRDDSSGLSTTAVSLYGYRLAVEIICNSLSDPDKCPYRRCPVPWSDAPAVKTVVGEAMIRTVPRMLRLLSLREREYLSAAVLDLFLSSVTHPSSSSSSLSSSPLSVPPAVTYLKVAGRAVTDVGVSKGSLIMEIPISGHPQTASHIEGYVVAIFDCSLEFGGTKEAKAMKGSVTLEIIRRANDDVGTRSSDDTGTIKYMEYAVLIKFFELIKRSHVTLLACQQRVHPYLMQLLTEAGIICIPRVSIRYIGALARLSGALILGGLSTEFASTELTSVIEARNLGYLGTVEFGRIFGKLIVSATSFNDRYDSHEVDDDEYGYDIDQGKNRGNRFDDEVYAFALGAFPDEASASSYFQGLIARRRFMFSVILTAPSETLCDDLEVAVQAALNVLSSLLDEREDTYIIDGPKVRPDAVENLNIWRGIVRKGLESYIDAPMEADSNICESEPLNICQGFTSWRLVSAAAVHFADVLDDECSVSIIATSKMTLEGLRGSIKIATEIATTILGIDNVIIASH